MAKIPCTTAARNGTWLKCTWPPPPPPTPPPPLPPSPPSPPSPWVPCKKATILGCYAETKDHLLLKHYALLGKANLTLEGCASACNSLHFPVAGMDSNHCFCGTASELNPRNSRPAQECQAVNCSGDPDEKCGGNGRLLAYNYTCQADVATAPAMRLDQPHHGGEDAYPRCGGGVDTYPFNKSIPNILLVGDSVMFAHIGPVVKQIFDRCELAPGASPLWCTRWLRCPSLPPSLPPSLSLAGPLPHSLPHSLPSSISLPPSLPRSLPRSLARSLALLAHS